MATIADVMWNNIAWTSVSDVASGLKSLTTNAVSIANALRDGARVTANQISGAIQGIQSGLSDVGNALGQFGGAISSGHWWEF